MTTIVGGGARTSGGHGLHPDELTPLPAAVASSPVDPLGFPGYRDLVASDPEAAAAVAVGTTVLGELEVVAAIGRFEHLGGSMGAAHGERVARAMAVAEQRGLPFLAVVSSGGARMQEGMVSLVQMARTAEGVRRLRTAGIPVLSHLTHPSTGGVLASYGSLADVVVADDGATIGFAGPRVVEAFTGHPLGGDSHTARTACEAGLVDEVVAPDAAAERLAAWVGLVHPSVRGGDLPTSRHVEEPVVHPEAWDAVRRARRTDRPGARQLLAAVFDEHLELRGDRAGEDDPAAVAAVARLGRRSVVVLGTDRHGRAPGAERRPGQPTAAGFRKLVRGATLARRWGLPLVTLIDTPGADPSPASERGGLAGAIAETFVAVLDVLAPTVAVVTGEGGSGGAMALAAADRVLQQDDAVFEVIAPEGAAVILHRDPTRAREVAPLLRPTAPELRALGIVDRILPGPTTFGPHTATTALRAELAAQLAELDARPERLHLRRARYGPRPA